MDLLVEGADSGIGVQWPTGAGGGEMERETAIFVSGKISALRCAIGDMIGRYDLKETLDKELKDAIYALNRADTVLDEVKNQ